jgi:hypothetical protein
MPFRRASLDPGTSDVSAVYHPFRVEQVQDEWFRVLKGEAFYDPKISGEILDIHGLGLPFKINEKSHIYLQVFLDMSGRPMHAEICHTGNHLPWLAHGERWLGWPKMFSVSDPMESLPYYGIENTNEQNSRGVMHHKQSWNPAHRGVNWRQVDGQVWEPGSFGGGGDNGFADPANSWNVFTKSHKVGNRYRGIDRELRKSICTQKDVGTYASRTLRQNPPYNTRRQRKGYISAAGGYPDRGYYEVGGSRYPVAHGGAGVIHQSKEFSELHKYLTQSWLKETVKLKRVRYDQVACYYPIAYATGDSRPVEGHVTGIKIPADDSQKRPAYQLMQACKTHLQMVTVLEGDLKLKMLLPYQGFDNVVRTKSDGRGTLDVLDWGQVYPWYDRTDLYNTAAWPYPPLYMQSVYNKRPADAIDL